jgi:hypothetical protein
MSTICTTLAVSVTLLVLAPAAQAQHSAMPAGMTHEQHMEQMKKEAEMKEHGNHAMGFDQDTTTHHFLLAANGGSIAVDVKAADDQTGREQIRTHLKEIAVAFKQGDFGKPVMTHSEQPPGVPVMQRLKAEITYTYAETERGGIVRIATANAEALAAVHTFLKYQITEHATGDPLTVPAATKPNE